MELKIIAQEVEKRLPAKRFAHTMGCVGEAERLAKRWGADPEKAKTAAVLHDVTKSLSYEAQLNLCEKYGIIPDNVERIEWKILHAPTGAAVAADEFGADAEVTSAIRFHTTGKADMTILEKVIYLADFIEPSRDFEGVEKLRELAYIDLDSALLLAFDIAIEDVIGKKGLLHQDSIDARNFLLIKGR